MVKRLGRSLTAPPGPLTSGGGNAEHRKTPEDFLKVLLKSAGVEHEKVPELEIHYLPIHQIARNPGQPRRRFEESALEDLAESIRSAGGIIQPLIVERIANDRYQIVAGERRWRAAAIIDLETLPCIVRDELTRRQALVISLIENIQREDLNAIEEARGLRSLVDEFGLSHAEAANAVGKSRSSVSNLLRLLDLDEAVQGALADGRIEIGHAKALAALSVDDQATFLSQLLAARWTVRQTETALRDHKAGAGREQESVFPPYPSEDVESLERHLANVLGYRVTVAVRNDGRVSITLASLRDLTKLSERIEPT